MVACTHTHAVAVLPLKHNYALCPIGYYCCREYPHRPGTTIRLTSRLLFRGEPADVNPHSTGQYSLSHGGLVAQLMHDNAQFFPLALTVGKFIPSSALPYCLLVFAVTA